MKFTLVHTNPKKFTVEQVNDSDDSLITEDSKDLQTEDNKYIIPE